MADPWTILGTLGTYGGLVWQFLTDRRAREAAGETVEDDRLPQIMPPERRNIVGRARKLAELRRLIKSSRKAMITSGAVVQGEGGMGKTTMARHYVHKFGAEYKTGCWIRADDRAAMFRDIMTYGAALFQFQPPKDTEIIGEAGVRAVLLGIEMLGVPVLLIYDNADEVGDVADFIPPGDHIDILVTTRATGKVVGFERLEMDAMEVASRSDEGVALLLQEAEQSLAGEAIRLQAWELAKVLGGLPLALVIAGAMVRQGETFSDLCRDIAQILHTTPAQDGGAYRDSIAAAVQLSYNRLSEDGKAVADTCAWFAPEGIETRLFTDAPDGDWWGLYREDIPEVWQGMLADAPRVRGAFAELRGLSILRGETPAGPQAMHRLTAACLRRAQPGGGARFARAAAALVKAVYPSGAKDPQDPAHWPACRRLTPHGAAIWAQGQVLWDAEWGRPGWAAMDVLLNQMGVYHFSQENRAAWIETGRGSLQLKEARLGEDARDIPLALGNLGAALARAQAFSKAEEMLERAVDLDRKHRPTGEGLPGLLIQRAQLEFERHEAGDRTDQPADLGAAQDWILEAKGLFEAIAGGAPHAKVAFAWNTLGYLHRLAGRAGEMAGAAEAAYGVMDGIEGVNQVDLATLAMNAGAARLEAGQADRAAPLLQRAWRIFDEIHAENPEHSKRRDAASWYCSCLIVQGQEDDARAVAQAAGLDWAEMLRIAERYKQA